MVNGTIAGVLRDRAQQQPEALAFRYLTSDLEEPQTLTYAELDSRARLIAASLEGAVQAGERVLLLFPPGLQFVEALFGCFYAGGVAVPLQPPPGRNAIERLRNVTLDAQPALGLTDRATLERVRRSLDEVPEIAALKWTLHEDISVGGQSAASFAKPNDLAMLQYTSGSSGTPKGVMLSHANVMENAAQVHLAFGSPTRPDEGMVCWLPPFHDMGMMSGVLGPIFSDIEATLMSPLVFVQRPRRWLEAIGRFRATMSGAPNFAYEQCILRIPDEERDGLDLSSWRVAFCGAEPVRLDTLKGFGAAFAAHGFRSEAFLPCYGLAEATVAVTGGREPAPIAITVSAEALQDSRIVDVDRPGRSLVACGPPIPGVEIQIVDLEQQTLSPAEQVGEIWVRGPNVGQGYWGQPERTQEVFNAMLAGIGPFLRTGDLGFMREGRLFVTGRAKDMIIVRGQNYYPQDIEASAHRSHDSLVPEGAAAFGIDTGAADSLVVVQEVQRTARKQLDGLSEAVRAAVVADHGIAPWAVVLVKQGQLPRTTSGKIRRNACRTMLLAGDLETLEVWCAQPDGLPIQD